MTCDFEEGGKESQVLDQLKKIEHVKEACLTYGVYDIVAKVEAETQEKLEEVITGRFGSSATSDQR
jgi:DNA-binding Lrp family transcriptional regulator